MILDDLVLDIRSYKWSHPGGRFVLEYNAGRDISKFFYGGYVLENGSGLQPHQHTNIARCIVNSLVVGRLEDKAKEFSARISSSSEVNAVTTCFTLRNEGHDVKFKMPPSYDIGSIGRHFLIRSFTMPQKKR